MRWVTEPQLDGRNRDSETRAQWAAGNEATSNRPGGVIATGTEVLGISIAAGGIELDVRSRGDDAALQATTVADTVAERVAA